ncbi:MAG: hypothetical protein EBY32_18585, partial [Proteobacteria bacterium]|nr:hypothetical protein [Pseudomonadota bacterium]
GWDLISGGNLTISANATNKFNVNLWSLNATSPETTGIAQNFNATNDYSWNIGTFTSISGFNTSYFNINTGAINGTGGFIGFNGNFTLSSNGTSLTLNYVAANVSLSGNGTWSSELPELGNSTISNQPIVIGGGGGNSTNDVLTGLEGIVFGSNMTGSTIVVGNDITIGGGGITNNSSYTQTVDLDLTLGANQTWTAGGGNLVVSGDINMGGRDLTTGGNFTNTISGNLSGNGSLTQVGPGTLNLGGNNSLGGRTRINGGTLEVGGSLRLSETDVNNGGTLAGTGELGVVNVNNGGTIAPGSNPSSIPSTIRIGNLVLNGGGNYNWQIWNATSTAGTGWDLISGGNLTVSANATSKFNVNLWSLNATSPETTGIAQNFNSTSDYSWNIGTFTSILGVFDPDAFYINTAAIPSRTGGFIGFNGNFTLSSNGTSLTLNYVAANVSLSGNGTWSSELPGMGNSTISNQPIVFGGSGGNSTNDVLTGIEGIVFGSNATGSITVNGTDVTIGGGGITNNSSYTQT